MNFFIINTGLKTNIVIIFKSFRYFIKIEQVLFLCDVTESTENGAHTKHITTKLITTKHITTKHITTKHITTKHSNYKTYQTTKLIQLQKLSNYKTYQPTKLINLQNISNSKLIKITTKFIF